MKRKIKFLYYLLQGFLFILAILMMICCQLAKIDAVKMAAGITCACSFFLMALLWLEKDCFYYYSVERDIDEI